MEGKNSVASYSDSKGRTYDIPDASTEDQEDETKVHDLDDDDDRSGLEADGM